MLDHAEQRFADELYRNGSTVVAGHPNPLSGGITTNTNGQGAFTMRNGPRMALLWNGVLCLCACVHCGASSEDGGAEPIVFSRASAPEDAPETLFIYWETKTYLFQRVGGERHDKPLPDGVADVIRPVLTGDLWHHYVAVSNNEDRCLLEEGYILDGVSVDGEAAGLSCFIPSEVTDDQAAAMLAVMLPIYERLRDEGPAAAGRGSTRHPATP